jgi:GNAT superfamily N-acetyltransferase
MADYPQGLVRTRELSDGRAVTIRPIRPEDAEIEQDFVRHLSEESRYSRFMSQLHELSASKLKYFTDIDYDRHLALIAVAVEGDREIEIGVARYVGLPKHDRCEFAIAVDDAWQGSGVAADTDDGADGCRPRARLPEHATVRCWRPTIGCWASSGGSASRCAAMRRIRARSRPSDSSDYGRPARAAWAGLAGQGIH